MNQSIIVLDVIIQRLEKEKELNPIKILGMPLTMNMMNIINTTIFSLAAAMINKYWRIISY